MKSLAVLEVLAVWVCATVSADTIGLDTLLQRTMEGNPEIQRARIELERAAGERLVFHSVALPSAYLGVAGGFEGGHRSGQKKFQPFGFGYGSLTQPFFNLAVPASWRRGDIAVLIAQQNLNIAVTQQLHAARVAFYTALYQRQVGRVRSNQRVRLDENSASEKQRYESGVTDRGAFVAAELQARELDPRIDAAERAYQGAILKLSEAIGKDYGQYTTMLEPEGELHYADVQLGKIQTAEDLLASRPDVQLARLLVRAAAEDQRIMEAAYYPQVTGAITGTYIPITSVRQTQTSGSSRRAEDVISSEARFGGAYTWRVIDNGKVGGAVAQKRAAKEINEILLHKLEGDASRDLARIRNDLNAVATEEKALRGASSAAQQNSATVQQNLQAGISSSLENRLAQNDLLDVETALTTLAYRQQLDLAELDRATGRYLRFVDAGPRDVR